MKCLPVASTPWLRSSPCKPRTEAAPNWLTSSASSPKVSSTRPQRGSRATSSPGATPAARHPLPRANRAHLPADFAGQRRTESAGRADHLWEAAAPPGPRARNSTPHVSRLGFLRGFPPPGSAESDSPLAWPGKGCTWRNRPGVKPGRSHPSNIPSTSAVQFSRALQCGYQARSSLSQFMVQALLFKSIAMRFTVVRIMGGPSPATRKKRPVDDRIVLRLILSRLDLVGRQRLIFQNRFGGLVEFMALD